MDIDNAYPTLHGATTAFWRGLPTPIAEVGAHLMVGSTDHPRVLFELTEASFAIALAYGMARVRQQGSWPGFESKLAADLERANLGNRLQAIHKLDRVLHGASGWTLSAPLEDGAALVRKLMPNNVGRNGPNTDHVLNALIKMRNHYAHPSASGDVTATLQDWEDALGSAIRSNALLTGGRLLHVTQVRKAVGGGWELTAQALEGPSAVPYRRGDWQKSGRELEPDRLYLRDQGENLIELWPYMQVDDQGRAFVLSELRRGTPMYWHPSSKSHFAGSWRIEGTDELSASPSHEYVPAVSVEDAQDIETPLARRLPLTLMAAAAVAALVLLLFGASLMWWVSTDAEEPAVVAPQSVTPQVPQNPGTAAVRAPLPSSGSFLAALGAPVGWGGTVENFHAPGLFHDEYPRCPDHVQAWKFETAVLPSCSSASAFFLDDLGMFEVDVRCTGATDYVMEELAARIGQPSRRLTRGYRWVAPDAEMTLASTRSGVDSLIRVFHLNLHERFRAQCGIEGGPR